jgi:hypothetical protein
MKSSNGRSKDVLAYFRELAESVALRTNEGESLLAMKYRQLNIVSHRSIRSWLCRTLFSLSAVI